MLFEGVILPVVIALIRGGSLRNLEHISIKGLPFLFIPLIIRFITYHGAHEGMDFFVEYGGLLQNAAFGLLLGFFLINRKIMEMKIVFVGVALNLIAIFANGGVMPVSERAMALAGVTDTPVGTHAILDSSTTLPFLSDVIPIPEPYPFATVVSIGDIILTIGVFILIYRTMMKGKNTKIFS